MDKLVSWSFISDEASLCTNCGMNKEDSKGCCKDEQKQVKLDDQKTTGTFSSELNWLVDITVPVVHHDIFASSLVADDDPVRHLPPNLRRIPVYLSNCVFRI